MINLTTNAANTVTVTLTEKAPAVVDWALFELRRLTDGTVTFFCAQNTSTAPSRYDEFTVTVSPGDPLNGFADLAAGRHEYKVWWIAGPTLVPDSPEILLETGWCEVESSQSATPEFAPTQNTTPTFE